MSSPKTPTNSIVLTDRLVFFLGVCIVLAPCYGR
jgi:hypothetical protein